MLGSGRAGRSVGRTRACRHRRSFPTGPAQEPEPPASRAAPRLWSCDGSSLSPTRPLGSARFPAVGGTCPPGRRTSRSFSQAQSLLVPRGRPWSLWPEPLPLKARHPVAGPPVLVLGSGCPHRAPHSPPHTWWSPTTYETPRNLRCHTTDGSALYTHIFLSSTQSPKSANLQGRQEWEPREQKTQPRAGCVCSTSPQRGPHTRPAATLSHEDGSGRGQSHHGLPSL